MVNQNPTAQITAMDFQPSLELARLYMSNLDEEKAINLLKGISDKAPENSSVQMLLGIAMARNHQEKDGFEEYIQAFGKARTLGYPMEAKELVEKNHDSVPDAIKEQRAIADKEPSSIQAKLLLAEMLILQNRVPEARAVLDSQKARFKDNAELHRLYAEIYHNEGKEEQAYQEWLTANTLEKKSDEDPDAKPDQAKNSESSEGNSEAVVDDKKGAASDAKPADGPAASEQTGKSADKSSDKSADRPAETGSDPADAEKSSDKPADKPAEKTP